MTVSNPPTAPCVLIAEGDPWVRDMLKDMLLSVRCDARLHVCANGHEALSALASQPDLIIAARELPGIDGLDLLRSVRAKRRSLPFILISSRSDVTYRQVQNSKNLVFYILYILC